MINGLNPQVIRDLAQDMDSPGIAMRFLSDFLEMLPHRLGRIQAAVAARDEEDAMDAALSLTITAAMTGAADTESCCRALQASIRNLDFDLAHRQVQDLAAIVVRLQRAAPSLIAHAREALGLATDQTYAGCAAAW